MAPLSAYMLFCAANREAVRQRLASGTEKASVTAMAKELGQMWKALTDEERAVFKAQHQELLQKEQQAAAAAQQAQDGAGAEGGAEDGGSTGADKPALPTSLPVGWVRRLVALDPEIQRCSADGAKALSAAADVFLSAVCEKAVAAAAGAKRRTVRLDDVARCVRGDKRLMAAGFNAVIAMVTAEAAAAEEAKEAKPAPPPKRQKVQKDKDKAAPAAPVNHNSIERAFGMVKQA